MVLDDGGGSAELRAKVFCFSQVLKIYNGGHHYEKADGIGESYEGKCSENFFVTFLLSHEFIVCEEICDEEANEYDHDRINET